MPKPERNDLGNTPAAQAAMDALCEQHDQETIINLTQPLVVVVDKVHSDDIRSGVIAMQVMTLFRTETHRGVKPYRLWFSPNENKLDNVRYAAIPVMTIAKHLIASEQMLR